MNTTNTLVSSLGAALLLLLTTPFESGAQNTGKPTTKDLTNPSPVRTSVDPSTRIGTVRLPNPLERSPQAMAKLGLQPTQLQSGVSVNYSAKHIEDRDGYLTASCVSVYKRDGHWIMYSDGGRACPTSFTVYFRTQRGKRYLVDFAFDPARTPVQFMTYGYTSSTPLSVTTVDGHHARVVDGTGGELWVRLESVSTTAFVFFHAKVTPVTS